MGVFESMLTFSDDAGMETFNWILESNGVTRG
jgi:hypothetical protein